MRRFIVMLIPVLLWTSSGLSADVLQMSPLRSVRIAAPAMDGQAIIQPTAGFAGDPNSGAISGLVDRMARPALSRPELARRWSTRAGDLKYYLRSRGLPSIRSWFPPSKVLDQFTPHEAPFGSLLDSAHPEAVPIGGKYPDSNDPDVRARAYALHVQTMASPNITSPRWERRLHWKAGSLRRLGIILGHPPMLQFLSDPRHTLGAKEAVALRILCLIKNGGRDEHAMLQEVLAHYLPSLEEERYRVFGSEGVELEVKGDFTPDWARKSAVWLYKDCLGLWTGDDDLIEFKIYPSYSWKTQAAIIHSLFDLEFLPLYERDGTPLWNSLHINTLADRRITNVEELFSDVELVNLPLFSSKSRREYFAQWCRFPMKKHSMKTSVHPILHDRAKFLQDLEAFKRWVRIEYRMGEAGHSSLAADFAGRLRSTQILHGITNLYACAVMGLVPPGRLERDLIELYPKFFDGLMRLRQLYPALEALQEILEDAKTTTAGFAAVDVLQKDPEAIAAIRALVDTILGDAKALLDRHAGPKTGSNRVRTGFAAGLFPMPVGHSLSRDA